MMKLFDDSESWVTLGIGVVLGAVIVVGVAYVVITEFVL